VLACGQERLSEVPPIALPLIYPNKVDIENSDVVAEPVHSGQSEVLKARNFLPLHDRVNGFIDCAFLLITIDTSFVMAHDALNSGAWPVSIDDTLAKLNYFTPDNL